MSRTVRKAAEVAIMYSAYDETGDRDIARVVAVKEVTAGLSEGVSSLDTVHAMHNG